MIQSRFSIGLAGRAVNRLLGILDGMLPAVFVLVVIVSVTTEVFLRNVFRVSIPNAVEASTYLFVWMVFLGAAGASRCGEHFRVDARSQVLPRRWRRRISAISELICAGVAAVMTIVSWGYTMRGWNRLSSALEIPLGMFYIVFPFAFLMMSVAHLGAAARLIRDRT